MGQRVLLSAGLLTYLIRRGYTHMQLAGILPRVEQSQEQINRDDYLLIPWKESILLFEEADLKLEEIASTDISDMLEVEFGIDFWVELTVELSNQFNNEGAIRLLKFQYVKR